MYVKPSGVFFMAPDLARSLGKRNPSSDSFSPESGMCAATYTNPITPGSMPASVITDPDGVAQRHAEHKVAAATAHVISDSQHDAEIVGRMAGFSRRKEIVHE